VARAESGIHGHHGPTYSSPSNDKNVPGGHTTAHGCPFTTTREGATRPTRVKPIPRFMVRIDRVWNNENACDWKSGEGRKAPEKQCENNKRTRSSIELQAILSVLTRLTRNSPAEPQRLWVASEIVEGPWNKNDD
jgi:hypothetical protein